MHTDHPSAETLEQFVAGRTSDEERVRLELHVDQCGDCRTVLSELVRSQPQTPVTEPRLDLDLLPPERLGRYLVLGRLGSGGMGVVWEAYDPSLNRKVAIKVLKRARFGEVGHREEQRARFVREARAMALLSHPNVAQVYDIGEANGDVFIAMELLTGGTLRQWMKPERATQEVLRKFLEAGRGLAAAHAAGLVHRDFKPDNVLLGVDGQAKVTDFGLARADGEPAESSSTPSPVLPLESVTLANDQVVGTPKYMSPEQRKRQAIDARSDQFSYCVALSEALKRGPKGELASNVPPAVLEALERGLSSAPADRFQSMEQLLDALQPPKPRRWQVLTGAALALFLIGGGTALWRERRIAARCTERAARLSTVWNPELSADVEQRFEKTGSTLSGELFQRVKRGLDEYGAEWSRATEDACLETAGDQLQCLDERLARLSAAVEQLRTVTADDLPRVPNVVNTLPLLRACADQGALRDVAVEPPPASAAQAVQDARALLHQAEAADALGRGAQAKELVEQARQRVTDHGFLPIEAEVAGEAAKLQATYSGVTNADHQWVQSIALASAANHRLVLVRSWLGLSESLSRQSRFDEADAACRTVRELIKPLSMPEERVVLERTLSTMAIRRGRFDEGLRRAQQARSDAIAIFGDRSLAVADAEVALGIVFNGLHKRDRSVEHFVRAAQLQEQVLSPNHPAVGKSWAFAGYAMCTAGQLKEGLEAARKGLAISRRSLSPESPDLAHRLWMVAGCSLLGEGRTKEQPELTEALAIVADRPGIDRVNVWFNVGVSKFFQGKYLEGREAFTKALVDAPLDTPTVSYPLYGLGRCELELGNLNEARTAFGRARAAASSEAPIAEIEGFLGITEWRLGERAESVVRIRRTCAVMRRSQWWEFIDNRFIESFTRAVHEFPELERACEDTP